MPTDPLYRIRKVRLINFHNFVDETVAVPNGGHLFLLGDNGSGKTTLLDAIHLVLTANEDVEFNAAARVAGSARLGRRLQGVILRQNMEAAGPLNPQGGITYAALEIAGWQGKPLCLVLGMEAHALDEQVRYWGAAWSGALQELPLYTEQDGQRFPATWRELKSRLGPAFCPDLKSYRQTLIQRLYGNEELFRETCRLLRMGKAYREIAASTGDYHELFKRLLPDPQRELFETVIRTLRELDQSQSDLAGLEEKQSYLASLADTVDGITRHREAHGRYTWLIHHLTLQQLGDKVTAGELAGAQAETALAQCRETIRTDEERHSEVARHLSALQQTDASGLLTLLKERKEDEGRLLAECAHLQEGVKGRERERTTAERDARAALQGWRSQVTGAYTALHRLRADIPFPLTDLLGELDRLGRLDVLQDAPELTTDALAEETQRALMALATEVETAGHARTEQRDLLARLEGEIAELSAREELAPPVAGFREACLALERALIAAVPLYRGLEWAPGLSAETRVCIEEALGPDVLGILLVSGADYDAAAGVLFPRFPGIRLANREAVAVDPPAWVRESFSLAESQPWAIRALAAEMAAGQPPAIRREFDAAILRFRSHERRLRGDAPALIGERHRRDAVRERLRNLQSERKSASQQVSLLEKALTDLATQRSALAELAQFLRVKPRQLDSARHAVITAHALLAEAGRRVAERRAAHESAVGKLQACRALVADLQARIGREGLDTLEKRQRKVARELQEVTERLNSLRVAEGGIRRQLDEEHQHLARLKEEVVAATARLRASETLLAPLAAGVESVAYYVLRTWRGQQFERVENVQVELERAKREEAGAVGSLRERVNHPTYGAVYAFTYDVEDNRLTDRHGSLIHEVVEAGGRLIADQREVINERTRELIRNLIMGDLFTELKGSVRRLREMVRKINHLLAGRVFGSTRYRFHLDEDKRYRDLVQVIERYNPLNPDAQEELETFLEKHNAEIMNTEVNDIPEALDYRNWFQYQLKLVGEGEGGEVVMTQRTRTLGSGGEQAVPNYLLILTVATFLYDGNAPLRTRVLLFDEAFYGIDASRRDQLLGFASDIGLQLFVASPDLDGVKQEIPCSTTLLVVKDEACDVHLFAYDFTNPRQFSLFDGPPDLAAAEFRAELGVGDG
jgi:uncharacterized protein YPO0396